jgi:hypothetical protein
MQKLADDTPALLIVFDRLPTGGRNTVGRWPNGADS